MEIVLAKSAGYCFGVKRATQMAFEATDQYQGLCSLGPIIHSPQLVSRLEEKGVRVVDEVPSAGDGAVIVRSHGVTRQEMEQIAERRLEIIDATCPFVKKAQEYAAELSEAGYQLVVVGEAEHPEVQGIVSYGRPDAVRVVASPAEAEQLPRSGRLGVIAQTTQSFDNFRDIVGICLRKAKEVRIYNTICDATAVRQDEACRIASGVEVMLVVGGRNSANTTRLATLCRELQPATYHIETADDLTADWFSGVETVGVTAGASTPSWVIEQVVERLGELASQAN